MFSCLLCRPSRTHAVALPVTERERQASELLRQNFLQVTESWRPGLLINGFPEDAVDTWIAGARDEIINMKVHIYGGVRNLSVEMSCGYRCLHSITVAGKLGIDANGCRPSVDSPCERLASEYNAINTKLCARIIRASLSPPGGGVSDH